MEITEKIPVTRYDIDLLNKIIIRDDAKLIGSYETLNVYSVINFLCKCSKEGSKKFRSLYNKGGAFCKECAKINGKQKSEATNLEKFGVINPFMLKEVQDKIKKQIKGKTVEEKNKIIEKRLNTVKNLTDEEKKKTIEKRLATMNEKSEEEKTLIKAKRVKTNNSKTEEEKNIRKTKIKATCMSKYGVDSHFKSKELIENRKRNVFEKYGVENVLQAKEVIDKIKATNMKKCGHEYTTQNLTKEEWGKRMEKRKQTNIERFGYENPAQHPETFEKIQESAKRFKEYKMPSGEIRKIQGYEGFALDELLKIYEEDQIKTDRKEVGRIMYEIDTKKKYYYPDIGIPHENKLIEVKSKFTYTIEPEKIKCKGEACKSLGFDYEIWVYDRKGVKEIIKFDR